VQRRGESDRFNCVRKKAGDFLCPLLKWRYIPAKMKMESRKKDKKTKRYIKSTPDRRRGTVVTRPGRVFSLGRGTGDREQSPKT